jgi:hypothetical protein
VYSSVYNSLVDKLKNLIVGDEQISVKNLGFSDQGAATMTGSSIELTKRSGTITTESLTAAAGGAVDLRLFFVGDTAVSVTLDTDAACFVYISSYSGTGLPIITKVVRSGTFFQVSIQNIHASAAFNAALKIKYFMINV